MSDDAKRNYVASLYPGPRWRRRVSKMSDAQVLAIYFKAKAKEEEAKEPKKENQDDDIPF
jgi:hypothetical protein